MNDKKPEWYKRYSDRVTWLELNQNLQIDLRNRYVYFEVAKAACSTVKKRLTPLVAPGMPQPKVVHPNVLQSPFVKPFQLTDSLMENVLDGKGILRFTFLREPTERFVSGYLDKIARENPNRERFRQACFPELAEDAPITPEMFLDGIRQTEKVRNIDKHWRPQADLIFDDVQSFDFVGTLANFERDWDYLMHELGVSAHENKQSVVWHATDAKGKISQVLTPDLQREVEAVYARDYELYASALEHTASLGIDEFNAGTSR